jgi:hypothetical protein
MRTKLQELKKELRKRMHRPIPEQGRWLAQVVRSYLAYHAVPTNGLRIGAFRVSTSAAISWVFCTLMAMCAPITVNARYPQMLTWRGAGGFGELRRPGGAGLAELLQAFLSLEVRSSAPPFQ